MNPTPAFQRTIFQAGLAVLGAAVLAACGGGGGADSSLTATNAQGYAADSATMSVSAASSADSSISTIETALTATLAPTAAGAPQMQAQATASAVSTGGSGTCANGGSVSWTVTAPTLALATNGQFDSGESYSVTYTNCGSPDGDAVLDGNATLVVNTRTATTVDITHSTTALTLTTLTGKWVTSGSTHAVRSVVDTSSGGVQFTSQFTSSGITLDSTIGARQAHYALKSLSWTVVRTYDATGVLTARSHQGSVAIDASTPRRPNATLQVTTNGALTVGSDGLATSGSFSLITAHDTIACTYGSGSGSGSVTLTLDLGSDGKIDGTWTLTRTVFNGEAG